MMPTSLMTWPLVMLCASVPGAGADCPAVCECRWKGGKQVVECDDECLLTIPAHIDASTQVLRMSDNNIQILPIQKFQRMGLTNLQRIILVRCKISEVDDHALLGLTNLVELDLSSNFLTAAPSRTFGDVPALMRLSLSGNPIRRLSRASFAGLTELNTLELSRCELDTVEPGVFADLTSLKWLRLDGNRLTRLAGDGLSPQLHGVDLHGNPWACDCRLRRLRRWMVLYKVPASVAPRCATPRHLAGLAIRDVEKQQLACLPDISPGSMFLEVSADHNVSLSCRVRAEPPANVTWTFNGQQLGDDSAVSYRPYAISEHSEDSGRLRHSQLTVVNASVSDQGVFRCRATNEAGVSVRNYTLRVLLPAGSSTRSSSESEPPERTSYFAIIVASLIFLVVALVILACIVAISCSRRRRPKGEPYTTGKTAVVNIGVDTPSVTCSTPKIIQTGTAPTRSADDGEVVTNCQEHVAYIGQRCCTSPLHRSGNTSPDVLSNTEAGVGRSATSPADGPAYQQVSPTARLGPVWRSDEPAPLVHLDGYEGGYPSDFGLPQVATMGRSRRCHSQVATGAGSVAGRYRSLPRHRHGSRHLPRQLADGCELRQNGGGLPPQPADITAIHSIPEATPVRQRPPPPPRTWSAAPEWRHGDGLPLQGARPGGGRSGAPETPLDSSPKLVPPEAFTDYVGSVHSRAGKQPHGDPNTAGLPPLAEPIAKFGHHATAAHCSLHESPDEGYEEPIADGTDV